jgi:hypothetical protein
MLQLALADPAAVAADRLARQRLVQPATPPAGRAEPSAQSAPAAPADPAAD